MPNFVMRLSFLLTENGCDTRKEAAELAINLGMRVLGIDRAKFEKIQQGDYTFAESQFGCVSKNYLY